MQSMRRRFVKTSYLLALYDDLSYLQEHYAKTLEEEALLVHVQCLMDWVGSAMCGTMYAVEFLEACGAALLNDINKKIQKALATTQEEGEDAEGENASLVMVAAGRKAYMLSQVLKIVARMRVDMDQAFI